MDCSPPGFSVHGILQASILEWVVIPSSRNSSQLRDQTQVSHIAGGFFTVWAQKILGWEDPLEKGDGYPCQYSCQENPMDRGAWRATVHGVTKSQTQLTNTFTFTFHSENQSVLCRLLGFRAFIGKTVSLRRHRNNWEVIIYYVRRAKCPLLFLKKKVIP